MSEQPFNQALDDAKAIVPLIREGLPPQTIIDEPTLGWIVVETIAQYQRIAAERVAVNIDELELAIEQAAYKASADLEIQTTDKVLEAIYPVVRAAIGPAVPQVPAIPEGWELNNLGSLLDIRNEREWRGYTAVLQHIQRRDAFARGEGDSWIDALTAAIEGAEG